MIYEFITYPHEICYRPNEVIGHCYQEHDFVETVFDSYSFHDLPYLCDTFKNHHDDFDIACMDNDVAIAHVKNELKLLLDSFIDSLGDGWYAFNLHNKDLLKPVNPEKPDERVPEKPHFHIILCFNENRHRDISIYSLYDMLGMYKYVHDDFQKRGKTYSRLKREYPRQPYMRVYEYFDYMRSDRLRYLCHLDNPEKYPYDLQSVIASFDYPNDSEVRSLAGLTPFAMFLKYKAIHNLDDEVSWFEWLACAKLPKEPTDVRAELARIKTDIHRYYVAVYYRSSRKGGVYV